MADPEPTQPPPEPIPYATMLAPGQLRVIREGSRLTIWVGAPPVAEQVRLAFSFDMLILYFISLFTLLLLATAVMQLRGALAVWIGVPIAIALGGTVQETLQAHRRMRVPVVLEVDERSLTLPLSYRSRRPETIDAARVVRLRVAARRTLLQRRRHALYIDLGAGATIRLLDGYPQATLDEVAELLGPALGLTRSAV